MFQVWSAKQRSIKKNQETRILKYKVILGRKNAQITLDSLVPHPTFQETLKAILWRPALQPYLELDQPSCKLDKEIVLNMQEETAIRFRPKGLGSFWNASFFPLANCCYKMEECGKQDSDLDCGKAVSLRLWGDNL